MGRIEAVYQAVVQTVLVPVLVPALLMSSIVITAAVPNEAHAVVPRVNRVIDAIAKANRSGRRVGALRFKLNLYIGEGPPVAVGELVTHPTGLARLELRGRGLVERHILLGNQHHASRNARVLVQPREFLPPLFVMQSNSGTVLKAALATLGVDRDLVGLAPCGDFDCFVIGDPERAVSRPMALRPANTERAEETPMPANHEREPFASIWVDTEDFSVRQIESASGAKVVLGPYVSFEKLSVPLWWSIEEVGKRVVRFEVESVVEVNAPASAFSKAWLMTPAPEPSTPEADESLPSTTSTGTGETPAQRPVPTTSPPPVSAPGPGYDYHPDDEIDPATGEYSADSPPDYDSRY